MTSVNWNKEGAERRASNWNVTPKKTGFKRCGKSYRINTDNQKGDKIYEIFTPEEEELIISLHQAIGSSRQSRLIAYSTIISYSSSLLPPSPITHACSTEAPPIEKKWPIIAQQIPGRTENEVKIHWNTKLRKKLTEMGIDHVTHRPFSQLLAEYGNMSGLPSHGARVAPLNRELKDSFIFNSEHGVMINPQENYPNHDTSASHDLLGQLQAITLMTGVAKINNDINCSSSSSTSSSSFSWSDFLVEDPLLAGDEAGREILTESDSKQKEKQIFDAVNEKGSDFSVKSFEASSSSDCSFVEAMVDQQNEMLLDFPELLEDSFFY